MNMMVRAADITRSPGDPRVEESGPSSLGASDQLAKGLGFFSIGLGLLELFGARTLARSLNMEGHEGLIRAYGAREIASGVLTLSANPMPGIASRVAGDGLDLVTLLSAWRQDDPRRGNVELALLAVAGVTVLDLVCFQGLLARHARPAGQWRDYSDRSGFPKGRATAWGAARKKAEAATAGPHV